MTETPTLYDVRPGEGCVRNCRSTRQVVSTVTFVDPRSRPYRILLEARVVYIIPTSMGGRHAAQQVALSYHDVELVEDAERGALPAWFGPNDGSQVHRWLYGEPKASRAQKIEELVKRYELARPTLAECILRLTSQAGMEELAAVEIVRRMWDEAIANQSAYREPWMAKTDELIAAAKTREVTPA